jgi:outer membrane lipoprotein-sorting protein
MKRFHTLALAALIGVCDREAMAGPPDALALLKQADAARNGWPSFTHRVKITTLEEGQAAEEHLFQISIKGSEKTYVEFLSPREKGRHLLMLGDDMWIFLPDTRRPIRITPLERLAGNAANGDVARTSYSADYEAVYLREEMVEGVACHVLELSARRKGATYRKVHYWLRISDASAARADFFLASGKHGKSATFDAYETFSGQRMLKRMTIYDRIRTRSRSVLEFDSYAPKKLPDSLFHPSRAEAY